MRNLRTISAWCKPSRKVQIQVMHGGSHIKKEGVERVMFIETARNNDEIISMALDKCLCLGVELFKVCSTGSKSTSFGTNATWDDEVIYIDETNAGYYEGCFDSNGDRVYE